MPELVDCKTGQWYFKVSHYKAKGAGLSGWSRLPRHNYEVKEDAAMIMSYQQAREFSLGWHFPVRCKAVTFQNCECIHPLKQVDVQVVVNMLKKDERVHKVVVFGSAVSTRCHSGSDLDLYVEADVESARSLIDERLLHTELDVLTNIKNFEYGVGKAIAREGVTVFERK